jgi:hypothetical protein
VIGNDEGFVTEFLENEGVAVVQARPSATLGSS